MREYLFKYIDPQKNSLEIGPLTDPFLTKPQFNVYYADIRSTEDIKDYYRHDMNVDIKKIVPVDYVITGTYKEAIGAMNFNTVFSSHVIEHTTCVIGHLSEISEILHEGGRYVMCIPDKRFTFDHFREVTPFRDAYDVYKNGEKMLERLGLDHMMNCHNCNRPIQYIMGNISFESIALDTEKTLSAINGYENFKKEIGYHFWVFTYKSFLSFIRDSLRFNLLPFEVEMAKSPELLRVGANELHVVLKKNSKLLTDRNKQLSEIRKINKWIENTNHNFKIKTVIKTFAWMLKKGIGKL